MNTYFTAAELAIISEEWAEWLAEWWTEEEFLNEPHWGFEERENEVSDEFIPALLWVEEEHY